jgi:5'-deoxynucleotidase YfbR-like HD superfamily hydrolase
MEGVDILKILISYLIPTVLGAILGYISTKFKKSKKEEEEKEKKEKAIEEGLQALLRNELVRRYREYETKGELTILDKENIEAMFKQYEILGGNGTVKHLMEELLSLPTKVIKG